MARTPGLLPIALLAVLLSPGCSKLTASAPDFPFTGSWTGRYTDYLFVNMYSLKPITVSLSMNVTANGTASASGQKDVSGYLDHITMSVTVMPDGAASGTGQYTLSYSGIVLVSEEGEVIGQFDAVTRTANGALCILIDGLPFHFPWSLEWVR